MVQAASLGGGERTVCMYVHLDESLIGFARLHAPLATFKEARLFCSTPRSLEGER